MLVDLMRNDLGRVAEIGSVEVVAPLTVEPYAKLHHLVTTVRARTRPGTDLGAVLRVKDAEQLEVRVFEASQKSFTSAESTKAVHYFL